LSTEVNGSVKAFFIEVEGGVRGTQTEHADRSVEVSLMGTAGLGAELKSPGAKVEGDEVKVSTPKGELSGGLQGQVARTWRFRSRQEAEAFQAAVRDKLVAEADIIPNFLQEADNYKLPSHTKTTVAGGVKAKAELAAGSAGYSSGQGNIGGLAGADLHANGDRTVFLQGGGGLNGRAGKLFASSLGSEVKIALTVRPDGEYKSMTVTGAIDGAGGFKLSGKQDLSKVVNAIARSRSGSQAGSFGGRGEFESTLNFEEHPEALTAAHGLIEGIDPATRAPVARPKAAAQLYEHFEEGSDTNARAYVTDKTESGLEVEGSVFGVGGSYKAQNQRLLKAYYRAPGEGFRPWTNCELAAR